MKTLRDSCRVAARLALVTACIGGCAAPAATAPATTQPALSAMAQPFADGLRKAGVVSVQVAGSSARIRTSTNFGEIYMRYPAGLTSTAFAVYVDATNVEVDSDTFTAANSTDYDAAIKAILPVVIRSANDNNTRVINSRFGKN
jgi:hypothetical protein